MKKTTVEVIKTENKRSYGIKVTPYGNINALDTSFVIPVIDVRDGENERRLANHIVKTSNQRSKFISPSFAVAGGSYQSSYKKK